MSVVVRVPRRRGRADGARVRAGSVYRVRWGRICAIAVVAIFLVHAVLPSSSGGRAQVPPVVDPSPAVATPSSRRCPAPSRRLIRSAPSKGSARTVALTFDDGPGPWTPQVLAVLRRKHVRASFFVIGRQAAAHPNQLRRIVADGHLLGNHTWSHSTPTPARGWRRERLAKEIRRTQRVLSHAGGSSCSFRPPGGVVKGARGASRAAGMSIVLWSVDTRDWSGQRRRDVALIRHRARSGLSQRHPVVLLHDGGGYRGATLAALPGVIDDYRRHGYRFVTLDGAS